DLARRGLGDYGRDADRAGPLRCSIRDRRFVTMIAGRWSRFSPIMAMSQRADSGPTGVAREGPLPALRGVLATPRSRPASGGPLPLNLSGEGRVWAHERSLQEAHVGSHLGVRIQVE